MPSKPEHIEEPVQGLVPIWAKDAEAQKAYWERLREVRQASKRDADKITRLHEKLATVLQEPTTLERLAKRLIAAQQRETAKASVAQRKTLEENLRYLAKHSVLKIPPKASTSRLADLLTEAQKRKISRLVRHPEEFISHK